MKNTLVILAILLVLLAVADHMFRANEPEYYYCDVDRRVEKKISEYSYEFVNQETVRRRLIIGDKTIRYWDTSFPAYKFNYNVSYPKSGFWPTWISFDTITLEIVYEHNWETQDGWYRRYERGTCTRVEL